jgi:hypothetical protein
MSLNPEFITAAKAAKAHMPIGTGSPARLIETLNRLGLVTSEMAEPLTQLAAAGKPLGKYFTVSVHDLDRALAGVECSVTSRMQFKAGLDRAGLLSVPKV